MAAISTAGLLIFAADTPKVTYVSHGKVAAAIGKGGPLAAQPDLTVKGGETYKLTKGHVIVVPAGIPHWFKEVPKNVNYYVVKVLKP